MDVTLGKLILMADLLYSLDLTLGYLILMADLWMSHWANLF